MFVLSQALFLSFFLFFFFCGGGGEERDRRGEERPSSMYKPISFFTRDICRLDCKQSTVVQGKGLHLSLEPVGNLSAHKAIVKPFHSSYKLSCLPIEAEERIFIKKELNSHKPTL